MKTILNIALFGVSFFCLLSNTVSAEEVALSEEIRIGQKIYDRSFGRGCGACHDIASNPQLVELIQAGELGIDSFTDTVLNGKNGMPKAIDAIMAVEPVQQASYTEEQAINAVYKYLEAEGKEGTTTESPPTGDSSPATSPDEGTESITPSTDDPQDNSIILNRDFSFNIPLVKLVDNRGITSYYDVDFIFSPLNNKLLFRVTKVIEIERSRINTLDLSNAIILNRDLSFNIPSIRYVDVDDSIKYYNADFIYTPINNKLIFEVAKVIELQATNANTTRCEDEDAKKNCQVIDIILERITEAKNAINEGANEYTIVSLIEKAMDGKDEIDGSDIVSGYASRANSYLKKASYAIGGGEMVKATEHLKDAEEAFEWLKTRL